MLSWWFRPIYRECSKCGFLYEVRTENQTEEGLCRACYALEYESSELEQLLYLLRLELVMATFCAETGKL